MANSTPRRPAKRAATRTVAVAVPPVPAFTPGPRAKKVAPETATLDQVHESQLRLCSALSNIYGSAPPVMVRYLHAVVPYLTQFVMNRIAEGMYDYLSSPCDPRRLRAHSTNKHIYTLVNGNRDRFYQDTMFGTDALPSWADVFDPTTGKYQSNVQFWVTLFVTALLTSSTSFDYTHKDYAGICRYPHWVICDSMERLYKQASDPAPEKSAPAAPTVEPRYVDESEDPDDEDEDEDEDEDDGDSEYISASTSNLSFSFKKEMQSITGPVCEERSIAMWREYCILPIVMWKEDLTTEASLIDAFSKYMDPSRQRQLRTDKDYVNVMMGHVLVEGVHFNAVENHGLSVVKIPEGVTEGLKEAFTQREVDDDFNSSEFTVSDAVPALTIVEDFYVHNDRTPAVVNIGRFFLSPSYLASLCGVYSRLNPLPSSREEALAIFAEKSLQLNKKERKDIESKVLEIRRKLSDYMTKLAEYNIREQALRHALASNIQEVITRVEGFGFQIVDITNQGHVFIQTGPQFGTFTSAEFAGQQFYVGNFQIIMAVMAASFVIRNVEAPIFVNPPSRGGVIPVIHPHSDDGDEICWGGYSSELGSTYGAGDYPLADDFEMRIRTLMMFLTTANRGDPYVSHWKDGLLDTVPAVTATTKWDTSMKGNTIPISTIVKSGIRIRQLADTGHDVPRVGGPRRIESEEGLKWIK